MGRRKKTETQKEADKIGVERIKRFEERQIQIIPSTEPIIILKDNEEESTMTAFQKKEGGEWTKIEVICKRKKKI